MSYKSIISGKATFGTLKQVSYQSDYITNKKSKLNYCNNVNYTANSNCKKNNFFTNYNQYNLFNNGRYLFALDTKKKLPFNKTNLIAGLYSKMNLTNVCTVINGNPCSQIESCNGCSNVVTVDASSSNPFYITNTIDPIGELFGNSQCGINNFIDYMENDYIIQN
jgi:hypothetical protein